MPAAALSSASESSAYSLDELVEFEGFDPFARSREGILAGVIPLGISLSLLSILGTPPLLWMWALLVAGVLLAALVLVQVYRRQAPRPNEIGPWLRRYAVLTGLSGLSWGSAGVLFVPATWQVEMYTLLLLGALSTFILANAHANHLPIYLSFVSGILLPTAVYRLWLGGALNLWVGFSALLSIVVLAAFAARLFTAARRSIRIGLEHKQFAEALAQRTREAEQASLDKSRFIAAASHDLRQPVHALGMLLDVLQGQALNAAAQETASRMTRVLESLESLFDGLLDISRLDSGTIGPRRTDFALAPLLANLADEFRGVAAVKGLQLRCRAGDEWVNSDPLLLERMLRNLIANAIRYTSRGGVVIGRRRRGDVVRIEVWDSGIGITADQQGLVFDEFYQVANASRDRASGLGLGLAIVRRLGMLLQHRIELRSRPGRGSVFCVEVAAASAPAIGTMARTDAVSPSRASWGPRSVLVVDDDALVRDALLRLLASWGCGVTACADGKAVRACLLSMSSAPDALVTDWRLPGAEDGLEVARQVRHRFGPALPVILITGDSPDDARRLADEQGIVMLHKPVRPAALRAALAAQWQRTPVAASIAA